MMLYLWTRTQSTLLDSLITIDSYLDFIVERGYKYAAIADLNVSTAHLEFYFKCKERGIHPVIGIELLYDYEDKEYSLLMYAKNKAGLYDIHYLSSIIQKHQKLNFKDIIGYSKDCKLIFTVNSHFVQEYSNFNEVNSLIDFKLQNFDYYLGFEEDQQHILELGQKTNSKIVYVKLAKYVYLRDDRTLSILHAIRDDKTFINQRHEMRYDLESIDTEFSFDEFLEDIDLKIIPEDYLPKFNEKYDSYQYLEALCLKGLEKRFKGEHLDRLKYELSVIKKMGYADYFLIVYDFVKFAKKANILVGCGRGSAAGSLVAYCLGITDIDPIKYQLLFERFLNPERVTMPDIDIDFADDRREEVIEYLKKRYGQDYIASIMTFNTFGSRQALRDVARSLKQMNMTEIKYMTEVVDPFSTLQDNFKNSSAFVSRLGKENLDIYNYALEIEGKYRHSSVHAAGIVISKVRLDQLIGVCDSNYILHTLQSTMDYLEKFGILKFDLLSLKSLTNIQNIIDEIAGFSLEKIVLNDPKVMQLFSRAHTLGVFQFESKGMQSLLVKMKPQTLEDLAIANALHRPGPMENINLYLEARKDNNAEYLNDDLRKILHSTHGVIVFQEQIMEIARVVGNLSLAEADILRRAMGKKDLTLLQKLKDKFIAGGLENNYSYDDVMYIYQDIEKFSNYGFNKSHAISYSYIGYQMAYLKTYYPLHYNVEMLNTHLNSKLKIRALINEGKMMNLTYHHVDINLSKSMTIFKDNIIILGFNLVATIGPRVAEILEQIQRLGEIESFDDFLMRAKQLRLPQNAIEALIYVGAFNRVCKENKATLIEILTKKYNEEALNYIHMFNDDKSYIVEEFSTAELLKFEKQYLGFYFNDHPTKKFITSKHILLQNITNYYKKYLKVVGLVEKLRVIKTKKGLEMAFATISDLTSEMEVVIFPNVYHHNLKAGLVLEIKGFIEFRNSKWQLVANEIVILVE